MDQSSQFTKRLEECADVVIVGGKAANLGRLIRAGFVVPNGFVITTAAFRAASGYGSRTPVMSAEIADEILSAYQTLGAGLVAVRSSATAEDMATASMAGQYETFLNIEGDDELLDAVRRCWASLNGTRVRAYLEEHAIDHQSVEMAVVVQHLVAADAAGVMFTNHPDPRRIGEMLIEASWGLGEAVVSGRVQPDVLRIDQHSGRVLSATIADKRMQIAAGAKEEACVGDLQRERSCLNSHDVHKLWQLGNRLSAHFGAPQDIEWAICAGEVYLLQTRPITTATSEIYENVLRKTKSKLGTAAVSGRGPWAVHNLCETLPHPTPLTWSLIGRFMSGSGAMGTMYREVGFAPSPKVENGFLELIAGRVYMDLSLAPEMFSSDFPFRYDFDDLLHRADAAQAPPTLPVGSAIARLRTARRLATVGRAIHALAVDYDRKLRDDVFPSLERHVAAERQIDLQSLSAEQLIERWYCNEQVVLDEFGSRSLLPSLICSVALDELRSFLSEHFWDSDPDLLLRQISVGNRPSCTLIADSELHAVANCNCSLDSWLAKHGHRAAGEFDLAAMRWRERPEAVREMAARVAGTDPIVLFQKHIEEVERRTGQLRAQIPPAERNAFDERVALVRRYMAFREDAKDRLMLGYDLFRNLSLEIGRRLDIGQDVFYLTQSEMFDALRIGFAPIHVIAERKNEFSAEATVSLPRIIRAADIDSIGKPPDPIRTAGDHQGLAISDGFATGPALILHSPLDTGELNTGELPSGYILVCPSTDPSWTPLFSRAAGLVLECGGALSHGAVVAREMGLPAVVLPDATRTFRDKEQIRVDGHHGIVGRVAAEDRPADMQNAGETVDPANVQIDFNLLPPPPGRKERKAARLRNWMALGWTLFLVAFFLLPASAVREPTMAILDVLLWPCVLWFGKPATVAIVATLIAVGTLLLQKLATDNRRLLVAKSRAAALQRQAKRLPTNSPRQMALLQAAGSVQLRTTMAAMVPIGVLLGPLVLPFVWFKERIDPSVAVASPGSSIQVLATIDGDWTAPIRLQVPESFAIDATTPIAQGVPPIRPTLEHLLALYRSSSFDAAQPWEMQNVPNSIREETADDLAAYLAAGIPPQTLMWQITVPANARGKFDLSAATKDRKPLYLPIAVGDSTAPVSTEATNRSDSPIRQLRVVYPRPKQAVEFWRPFAALANSNSPRAGKLASFDVGWLWLYLLVYVPVLFAGRKLLRVA